MALSDDLRGPWGERVRFSPEPDGFAFRPGVFLTPGDGATRARVQAVLGDGAQPDDGRDENAPPPPLTPDLPGGYLRWRYEGDTLRAVQQLRAGGVRRAQPVHVFFADMSGRRNPDDQPLAANPVYANPVYANPVYANPVYANPVYANPVYANPVYANPVYANPVYANPVYANPVYANPVYANPAMAGAAGGGGRSAPQSRVYPNPVYAPDLLAPETAARYRATGARASQAKPAPPARRAGGLFDEMQAWDQAPVRVAILDTGLDSTLAQAQSEPVDIFDNPLEQDGYLDPVSGHGTFILGLVRRIAPAAAVCVRQVISTFGDAQEDAVCDALRALIPIHPHVVNLSFSGYTLDKPGAMQCAIADLTRSCPGTIVVASAGNDGIDRVCYPAGFDGVIAVGALGPDGPALFSNHGTWVNACAPGVDLTSAFFTQDGADKAEFNHDPDRFRGRAVWSGTSFAAPVVAGAIARVLSTVGGPASPADAAGVVVDQPGLWRLPGYGTVVNVLGARPDLVW